MRLIDADALMKVIREHDYPLRSHFNSTDNGMFTIGVQQAVDEAPTIDAVPVVRGEWRCCEDWSESTTDCPAECQSAGYVCSACGIGLSEYLSESLGEKIYADNFEETPKITFCPNCGAKMDGESRRHRNNK